MGTLLQPLQETVNHYPGNLDICIIYDSVILLQSLSMMLVCFVGKRGSTKGQALSGSWCVEHHIVTTVFP